jgi:hypothetical protein
MAEYRLRIPDWPIYNFDCLSVCYRIIENGKEQYKN